ncbi:MAG: NUDIX hydrolase [Gammaproteobacteria bacterium]
MNYCSHCGAEIVEKVPSDDNRLRHVCVACERVHYQNPKIITGCIPVLDDRILLCKRAIEPRLGFWTLPAGFMELGETTQQAAIRETMEEANAEVDQLRLYTMFNLPHVNQVYMIFLARLLNEDFSAGAESQEVELYKEQDIPWGEMAFKVIKHTLHCFYADRERGGYRLHTGDIVRTADSYEFVPGLKTPADD